MPTGTVQALNKDEQRRKQNVKAAQKSYENKKKEREDLQQRNTDLTKQQVGLLLEKSELLQRISYLEYVLTSMNHKSDSCLHNKKIEMEPPSAENNSEEKNDDDDILIFDISDNSECCMALGLSSESPLFAEKPKAKKSCSDNKQFHDQITTEYCDKHILDSSSLGIGATMEVFEEVSHFSKDKSNKRHNNSDKDDNVDKDDKVFVPTPKKSKRSKITIPYRGCAADVLKKQQSVGLDKYNRSRFSSSGTCK